MRQPRTSQQHGEGAQLKDEPGPPRRRAQRWTRHFVAPQLSGVGLWWRWPSAPPQGHLLLVTSRLGHKGVPAQLPLPLLVHKHYSCSPVDVIKQTWTFALLRMCSPSHASLFLLSIMSLLPPPQRHKTKLHYGPYVVTNILRFHFLFFSDFISGLGASVIAVVSLRRDI